MSDPYINHYYGLLLDKLIDADYARFDKMEEGSSYCRPSVMGEQDVPEDAYCDYVYIMKDPGSNKPTRLFVTGEQVRAMRISPPLSSYH